MRILRRSMITSDRQRKPKRCVVEPKPCTQASSDARIFVPAVHSLRPSVATRLPSSGDGMGDSLGLDVVPSRIRRPQADTGFASSLAVPTYPIPLFTSRLTVLGYNHST